MHDTTAATATLLLLLAWGGVGAVFFWDWFLRDALRRFRRRSRAVQALIALGVAALVVIGGIKPGDPPLRTPPPDIASPSLTTNQCLAGFALVAADTNADFSLDESGNAVVHTNWLLRGASRDVFAIESTAERPWSFRLGTNRLRRVWVSAGGAVSFAGPFDSATGPLPDASAPDHLAPFHATLGIVPEANWEFLGTGEDIDNGEGGFPRVPRPPRFASLFWHDTTEAGSLRLTWRNALFDRDAASPVSFQTELFPSGDFVYRYGFGGTAPTSAVIGAQNNGGGEAWTNDASAQRVELRWRHFSGIAPGVADTDGDGLSDYDEVFVHGTDPARADSDDDGIADGVDSAPNNADANGDGIPDGATAAAWTSHPFLAENAGFTNLVLSVVRGMAPPLRSGNAPEASALLDVGGLKIPLRTGDAIPLGLPGGVEITVDLRVRGNLPVRLQLSPGPAVEPLRLIDPQGIFSHGMSADASARLSFPQLSLVPLTDTGTCCLHEGDTGAEFQTVLLPSGWDDALAAAEIEGFERLPGGTLWLDGPEPPSASNTGIVTIHTPWLYWGTLSASASVHWCISGGSYCHACGTVHTETDSCSHGVNCAARFSDDEDCDCPPMFLRVNFDDDDLDDVEDRYETPDFAWEDELEEFRFAGTGNCCCGCGQTGDVRAQIAFLSSGLRLWSEDGTRLLIGDDASVFASMEATAHSPTNGAFLLRYDILDRTGGVVRAMSRRFTAANVEILPDMDEDGDFDADDCLLHESLGTGGTWTVVRSPTPYRVRLRNACPADATLRVLWSTEGTNGPAFSTDSNLTTQYLAPNTATTNAPFALPNLVDEFLIDASRTSSVATLTYSLDIGGASPAVADSLAIRIVDIDLPDRAVRPSELASVEYDLSAASENVAWTLEDTATGNVIDWDYGPTYAPPTALPLGDYEISAYVWDVWEDGAEGTMRTATLRVADIAIEHEAYAVQVGSTSRVRVALDASVSTNAANWSITPSGNGAPLLYTSETGGIGRFYINNATEVWVGADSDTGEYVLTANCHSATNVIAEATVFSVRVSVDVDYGRTGVPSDSPNENDSIDFFGPCGAIVFTNLDDDDGDGEPDATDSIVNGVQDHEDFTTFSISKLGIDCSKVPSSWRFVVQIQNSEGTAFSSDYTMFISLESGMEGGIVLVYQEESLLNLSGNGDILLGIESRTPGANGLVKCGLQCDGYVLNDSARVLSTPFFIHSPKDPAVECYVSHSVAPGVFETFSQGCTGICSIIRSTDVPTVGQNNPMVYVRDHVCFGYTGMPTNHIDARRGELLLGLSPTEPDFSSLITDGTGFYFNAIDRNFGNLLLTPPDPMHPFGIAVCGTNFGYKAFLENQKVQRAGTSIPSIDVSWLAVPHVDNVVSFLPCGTAYVMLIADLDLATTILSLNASNPSYGENARMILESYSAQAENYAVVQGRLNAIRTYLAEHLGLADSAIVKVPVAFDVSSTSDVRPYFPNLVNLLYMERNGSCRILVPDAGFTPFWEQAQFGLRQKLLSLGFTLSDLVVVPTNIGSISPFRAGLGGDVHCISNVRYAMPSANGE